MRRRGTSTAAFAVRGAVATVAAVAVGTLMVLHGTGRLDRDPEVTVEVPAAVGLITGEAPVRFHGVNVGRIAGIEPGVDASRARLQIDAHVIGRIPASVTARVLPRTFFGDIYVQLSGTPDGTALADGDEIRIDAGPDAVALYDVYTRLVDVLDRMRPQQMQVALSTLAHTLDGRGATIGRTVDRLAAAAPTLTPAVQGLLDAAPDFRTVLQSLDAATPDVLATLESVTGLSRTVVDRADDVTATIGTAAEFAPTVADFVGDNRDELLTVLDASGTILGTAATNPGGLTATLEGARTFGAAGARVFATGRFDIVAVPTFTDPLPYTSADCPSYGTLPGACGPRAPERQGPQR
ncbi:MCE family protein [Prescottella sp. R16]|uniref:MCE family protein n=1 Tax=Prescottella sp. R16 TaxID=3064529 RepID=UPI00272E66A8|nr:MCE family protein [Prescottella sp. R16]